MCKNVCMCLCVLRWRHMNREARSWSHVFLSHFFRISIFISISFVCFFLTIQTLNSSRMLNRSGNRPGLTPKQGYLQSRLMKEQLLLNHNMTCSKFLNFYFTLIFIHFSTFIDSLWISHHVSQSHSSLSPSPVALHLPSTLTITPPQKKLKEKPKTTNKNSKQK